MCIYPPVYFLLWAAIFAVMEAVSQILGAVECWRRRGCGDRGLQTNGPGAGGIREEGLGGDSKAVLSKMIATSQTWLFTFTLIKI